MAKRGGGGGGGGGGAIVQDSSALGKLQRTSVLPPTEEVTFLDALVMGSVGAASAVWTATRPTTLQQVGWGTFLSLLGAWTFVEGKGELRYAGGGAMSSNLAVLAVRTVNPNLKPES